MSKFVSRSGFHRGGRVRVGTVFKKPSRTKQQFREECDINTLMKKYEKTGLMTHVNRHEGRYEDVAGAVDYQEAANIVMAAQSTFMSLPATVRKHFDNDPGAFMEFVTNPDNKDKMVELGLMNAPAPAPEPQEVRVVSMPEDTPAKK